jgi:hypothetical protein
LTKEIQDEEKKREREDEEGGESHFGERDDIAAMR